ncbi:DNA damage-binding protein 1a, partial [Cymbomonas tetramitiformis]
TVGEYHLGEFVNRFRHGSLVMCLPDSEAAQIPTLIFGTVNGVIGVLASLPYAQFTMLNSLQKSLNKVVKGTGGFLHDEWRSFSNERRTVESSNFIDGDLIEHFLDLKQDSQDEVARLMDMSVEEISKRVEELTRLH